MRRDLTVVAALALSLFRAKRRLLLDFDVEKAQRVKPSPLVLQDLVLGDNSRVLPYS